MLGDDAWIDVEQAAAASQRAESALQAGDAGGAAAAATDALAASAGAFLPDCDGPWLYAQRGALEALHVRAHEVLAEASLRTGELGAAVDAARAAIALAPFRESAHRLLMEAHEAAGNPAEALRDFEALRALLREELGTSPGPATMAVHLRLLHGGPPRRRRRRPRAVAARRWPAPLEVLRSRHAFVGRTAEAAALDDAWRGVADGGRALVVLTGEAGIGKTRLAAELAGRAHADGAVVLYGRFDEEAPAPYQPVVEMLRGWAGGRVAGAARRPARRPRGRAGHRAAGVRRQGAGDAARCAARSSGRSASGSSTRSPRCSASWRATRRSSSSSTTCSGRTGRRSSSSATSCAPRCPNGCCSWPRRAPTRARSGSTRSSSALRREGVLERIELAGLDVAETGALVSALGVGRRRAASSPTCTARPTATRSSSRRSSTSSPAAGGGAASRTACARSRGGGWRGSGSRCAGCSPARP